MRKYILLGILLIASVALARTGPLNNYVRSGSEVLDAQTLDAARTFRVSRDSGQGAWGLMSVFIQVTDANDSVTALTMTCSASIDGNTTDYALQDCVLASGAGTCYNLTWAHNPAATTSPKKWVWRVDIEGLEDVECVFTDTGGAAADLLDVSLSFATKGS